MDYKVLFVDEEIAQQDLFIKHFKSIFPDIKPLCEFPLGSLDAMLDKIWSLCPDAIITDFQLNEIKEDIQYTVKYDGIELLKALRNRRAYFPCFVMTSFDDEAVNVSDDVNLVYGKSQLWTTHEHEKVSFAARVIQQIDKYRARIKSAERELASLLTKRNTGDVNVYEEDRIIELDTFLERALGDQDAVPKELKKFTNLDRLNKLIGKVDELLSRI